MASTSATRELSRMTRIPTLTTWSSRRSCSAGSTCTLNRSCRSSILVDTCSTAPVTARAAAKRCSTKRSTSSPSPATGPAATAIF